MRRHASWTRVTFTARKPPRHARAQHSVSQHSGLASLLCRFLVEVFMFVFSVWTVHGGEAAAAADAQMPVDANGTTAEPEAAPATAVAAPAAPCPTEAYWQAVQADTSDFTAWTQLITVTEQLQDIAKLRLVYDAFLAEFPLCYGGAVYKLTHSLTQSAWFQPLRLCSENLVSKPAASNSTCAATLRVLEEVRRRRGGAVDPS
jgi:hypothetical protein